MAGRDPAIHRAARTMDARIKSGHDGGEGGYLRHDRRLVAARHVGLAELFWLGHGHQREHLVRGGATPPMSWPGVTRPSIGPLAPWMPGSSPGMTVERGVTSGVIAGSFREGTAAAADRLLWVTATRAPPSSFDRLRMRVRRPTVFLGLKRYTPHCFITNLGSGRGVPKGLMLSLSKYEARLRDTISAPRFTTAPPRGRRTWGGRRCRRGVGRPDARGGASGRARSWSRCRPRRCCPASRSGWHRR